jgi:hypothetical protein
MSKMSKKYALTLFLGILLVSAMACTRTSVKTPTAAGGPSPTPSTKSVGTFYPIDGTNYQLAAIETSYGESSGSGFDPRELFSYGRSNYSVHNYVFFDVDAETVAPLLPTNQQIILSMSGFPTPKTPVTPDEPKIPVAWWLYTLVKADTNGDGQLSYQDKQTLGISDVGGKGYVEMIPDIDAMLASTYKSGDVLLVIYHAEAKYYLAHIDLPSRTVTKTTELPSFGGDVK